MAKKAKAKPKAKAPAAAPDLAEAFLQQVRTAPPTPVSNVVTLDPDIAPHFPSSRAVNEALRALLRMVRQVRP